MVSVSRLLCGTVSTLDVLRYGRRSHAIPIHLLHFSQDKKPVVAWNITRKCNLFCAQCYAEARNTDFPGELTTEEAKAVLDDLAEFEVPAVLWSGGEPLMRPDLFELIEYANSLGLRSALSTNGTLLTPEVARKAEECGIAYVGVSIDGLGPVHDKNRGKRGAYSRTLEGIKNCRALGLRVGLHFTMHRLNISHLPEVFDLLESEDLPRLCVYHLAYSGRGEKIQRLDLGLEETRSQVEYIFDRVLDLHARGVEKEVLTVDNSADGVLLYLRVLSEQPERAGEVRQLLTWNGGNQSGVALGCIDNLGNVHPDQFSWNHSFGNVKNRRFSEIWRDLSHPVMRVLKNRKPFLKGRCTSCRFLDLCNGNSRARAESYHADFFAPDPACYLTDAEIAVDE